ncbi:MAG: bifunctional (p)ppGpp synthetase/guanosine-3',5'-bis(diphosphate) 3'-pyrophosphohydrolase [Deltaproteobacteria bacterium]|nr:bifunctional (p)ppGpp synthetase/guanosine-3',5'-bis(diphosphate) 3'-pyrophosphohydrolase [Deltaproteobacteria bacterium]
MGVRQGRAGNRAEAAGAARPSSATTTVETESAPLPAYGARFESALTFACSRHFGQERKGNGAPYITHPLAVAALVGEYGGDEDQAIAALLHDVLEDCGVTETDVALRYGARVARIVASCTDTTLRPKPPWPQRKQAFLARLRGAPPDVKLVVAADKLHNAQAIVRDLRRASVGDKVWSRFRAGREDVLWYYRAAVDALTDGWSHELCDELRAVVAELGRWGGSPEGGS